MKVLAAGLAVSFLRPNFLHAKLSPHLRAVGRADLSVSAILTLALGRLLLQDVIVVRLAAADLSSPGDFEPLGRSPMRLHLGRFGFRHCSSLLR